ncbi:phage virion morphogenesis protein [Phocaeicola plebeius]|uniref:phage virion morphogenesis protein n=1 Tax=Phocaeicola plebeius TaxID=310297 RepID=UPI0026F2A107|nr:phage virion morphogenesis protein [Phocaeicola plebeius]
MDGDFKKEVIDRSIEDIKVEFDEEFDRNFERKAFFDEKEWPERKFDDGVGSLLQRTGGLRRSVRSRKQRGELVYSSSKPYAQIHNEGGEIRVTRKMKGYFWHKLKETEGKYQYKKNGEKRGNKRNRELSGKEEFYRAMALKKVGSTVKIPERRFIGTGRNTDRIIREITEQNFEDYLKRHPIIDK